MLAKEKVLPFPGTLPRLPQQHIGSVFSTDVLSWKIVCSPLLKGLCALFFVFLWSFNDDLGCSLLSYLFPMGIFSCSLSLPVSLLLLVINWFHFTVPLAGTITRSPRVAFELCSLAWQHRASVFVLFPGKADFASGANWGQCPSLNTTLEHHKCNSRAGRLPSGACLLCHVCALPCHLLALPRANLLHCQAI